MSHAERGDSDPSGGTRDSEELSASGRTLEAERTGFPARLGVQCEEAEGPGMAPRLTSLDSGDSCGRGLTGEGREFIFEHIEFERTIRHPCRDHEHLASTYYATGASLNLSPLANANATEWEAEKY